MALHLIALLTPEAINQQVLQWKQYMLNRFQCKAALKSPAHITLIPPFHLAGDQTNVLGELLNSISQQYEPLPIGLKNFAAFAPRVIYINVVADKRLGQLKEQMETLLLNRGFPVKKENRPFHPHVTVANRDLKQEDFPEAWQYFKALTYETSFIAASITLLKHNGSIWQRLLETRFPEN